MQVRHRKHAICFGQLIRMYIAGTMPRRQVPNIISAGGTTLGDPRRLNIDWEGLESKMALRSLVEEDAQELAAPIVGAKVAAQMFGPDAVKTYTVARKKDGEIVGIFDTLDAAQTVIDKAKAAKKATLVLV